MSSEQSRSHLTYICIQSAAAAAAAALRAATLLLLMQQQQCCCFLLVFVTVCRMAKSGPPSLNLIPVFCFSSFQLDLFLMYPMAARCRIFFSCSAWQYRRIYDLDLPTSPRIAAMRGAKAAVSPPRQISPCKYTYRYVGPVVSATKKSDFDQVLRRKRPT